MRAIGKQFGGPRQAFGARELQRHTHRIGPLPDRAGGQTQRSAALLCRWYLHLLLFKAAAELERDAAQGQFFEQKGCRVLGSGGRNEGFFTGGD